MSSAQQQHQTAGQQQQKPQHQQHTCKKRRPIGRGSGGLSNGPPHQISNGSLNKPNLPQPQRRSRVLAMLASIFPWLKSRSSLSDKQHIRASMYSESSYSRSKPDHTLTSYKSNGSLRSPRDDRGFLDRAFETAVTFDDDEQMADKDQDAGR